MRLSLSGHGLSWIISYPTLHSNDPVERTASSWSLQLIFAHQETLRPTSTEPLTRMGCFSESADLSQEKASEILGNRASPPSPSRPRKNSSSIIAPARTTQPAWLFQELILFALAKTPMHLFTAPCTNCIPGTPSLWMFPKGSCGP